MYQKSLRQRIRKRKIKCSPWRMYKYEIRALPISSQCLFSKNGIEWDILEIELREEGWILQDEDLWDVLSDLNRIMMPHLSEAKIENENPFDDSWTQEDYENFYNNM